MKTFNYAQTSPLKNNLTMLGISILMIVFPLVKPFGVRLGSLHLLGPVPTTIIFVLLGAYLLFTTLMRIQRARKMLAHGCVITVDEKQITYPTVAKGNIIENIIILDDISSVTYDDEKDVLTISLKNGETVDFDADDFESPELAKELQLSITKQ